MIKRSKLHILILSLLTIPLLSEAQSTGEGIINGKKFTITSNVLGETREYWISLPDSYTDETNSYKRYPLMIVLDGPVFYQSFTGAVRLMSRNFNSSRQIPEMIVVAITNVNRERDFTPDKIVTKRPNNFGGGDKFLSFLEEELIPSLDKNYRTAPYRMLVGHSLGGLITMHAYMKQETLFNAFIAIDPSMGSWDAQKMDEKLSKVTPVTYDRYLYMATANWGSRNFKNRDRQVRLYEGLHAKCHGDFHAEYEYFEDENHGSVPLPAFIHGIKSAFKGYGTSYREVSSFEQLQAHYGAISERLSYTFFPPEILVNRIGYNFLRSRNAEVQSEALNFFLLNATNYPSSYNVFDSMGEAYAVLGDNKKAIESYQKSLELNPDNENAKSMIKQLEK